MCKILISIIVPCYNQAKYLSATLNSVLAQTYEDWECVIVNDGSKDNTKEVAHFFCDKDSRFIYVEQINKGLSSARNIGIKHSKGKYILPLDADDKIAPQYITKAISYLEQNVKCKLVYSRAAFFGMRRGEWNLPDYSLERLLAQNCIFCSAIFRRTDFNKIGGYRTNMKYGHEDWDFWLSLLGDGGDVYKINEVLFFYRIRRNSMARLLDAEKLKYLRHQLWENHRDLYAKYYWDITTSFEYLGVINSIEYRVGKLILSPLRLLYRFLCFKF